MAYMRSSVAFGLFWINFFITISIILLFTQVGRDDYNSSNHHSYNLRGTKEKLGLNNNEFPKGLRSLKLFVAGDMSLFIILYLDFAAIFFEFFLLFSFCLTKNECCTSDPDVRRGFAIGSCYGACICCDKCCCDCIDCIDCLGSTLCTDRKENHSNGGGEGGDGELVLLIFIILAFVGIYYALKACGKNISRIVFVIILLLLELAMAVLSMILGNDTYLTLIFVFSLIAAICNFLGILLPILPGCKYLTYEYTYPPNTQENLLPKENPVTSVTQPYNPPISADFPPQNMVEIPTQNAEVPYYYDQKNGYNSTSENIYDAPPVAPTYGYPQQNIYGNIPPPPNYPSPK